MKLGKVRETLRKIVIQYIDYRSSYEDHPNFFINIDLKQQYIRGNCVGRNDVHEQTYRFLVRSFPSLTSTVCAAKERFNTSFLKVIFTFSLSFFQRQILQNP